ncbi:hypothetical protein NQ317_006553, partial [Molorchus minor]
HPLTTNSVAITAGATQSGDEFGDDWDYKSERNTQIPVLSDIVRNHTLPPTANGTARLLWELDQEKTTHLPHFVDKALKLLNLKQVAFEIENSVMSKVSCTACRAGPEEICSFVIGDACGDWLSQKYQRASDDKNFAVVFFKDDDLWSEVTTAWLTEINVGGHTTQEANSYMLNMWNLFSIMVKICGKLN